MCTRNSHRPILVKPQATVAVTFFLLFLAWQASGEERGEVTASIRFSRDVLPILSDRCFHCHGPDEMHREADLRLDLEESAKADLGGYQAIAPGNLDQSELWNRITSENTSELMPPPDSHRKPLTVSERAAIQQWIESGAVWGKHWSLEPIVKPQVPEVAAHPIDAFVLSRLQEEGLSFSPPAPVHSQLRRLAFDLTGMLETEELINGQKTLDQPDVSLIRNVEEQPMTDTDWARVVERMLQSPHHAERMAMWWLDAARYSDSDGFQVDATRENWPWRDWVIAAFQSNMPFDQFTLEQFAGDLLPNATESQILATCFHRNHMTNGEGGRDPEESRIDYVIDRVNTTGTLWLGLTLACAQCHTHKFDPITQHEYYSIAAFFNSIDEDGKAGMAAKPYLKVESQQVLQRIVELEGFVANCEKAEAQEYIQAEQRFANWLEQFSQEASQEYELWKTLPPTVSSSEGTVFALLEDRVVQALGPSPFQDDYRISFRLPQGLPRVTGWRLEVFPNVSHIAGRYSSSGNGDFVLTGVRTLHQAVGTKTERELEISSAVADYERDGAHKSELDSRYGPVAKTLNDDARDGWTTAGEDTSAEHRAVFELEAPIEVQAGDRLTIVLRHRSTNGNANIGRFRISICSEKGEPIRQVKATSPLADLLQHLSNHQEQIDGKLRKRLLEQYLLDDTEYQRARERLSEARQQLKELEVESTPRSVMVLAERETPRETHVLVRGVWDAKGDVVNPGVLSSVLPWSPKETATRLDLANWIVDPNNPLTARVIVNHLWQMIFGTGIVRTPEDFGVQGEFPTHPQLLDWLASELIEHHWDLRHILRLMVTSQTYRQSSAVTPQLLERDPTNRWLARASRHRLPAWMLRDNALRVAGLLNPAIGGPPVKPYQPDGVWAEITMGRFDYSPSLGSAQYRRTLYAFWRRSIAPVFLFDSAQRRVCEVGVRRTNTPLQSLTLLNDETMREAARVLAENACRDFKENTQRVQWMSQRILTRKLAGDEVVELLAVWKQAQGYYEQNPQESFQLTAVGQQEASSRADIAAAMLVANLMLNLDEAITRE